LLHLIVRRGDATRLPSGASVHLTSIQFDPVLGVNEYGSIAFLSEISSGGRGMFVSSAVAVPEAASARLMLLYSTISIAICRRSIVAFRLPNSRPNAI
jgi:hypothetical protein